MSFKDGHGYNRGTRCKTVSKTRGDEWPNAMRDSREIGERSSTRSTTPSPLRMPLNSPPLPRTFPTFGIMEPRAGARSRVLAVISRLFGFITVVAIIEKFSRASRPNGKTAPDCLSTLCADEFIVKLKRFFIRHELSPFWKIQLSWY